jgi:uncharacterized membrane protein YsdA (DUF1294 family)
MIKKAFESNYAKIRNRISHGFQNRRFSLLVRARWIELLYILALLAMAAGIVNAAIQPVDQRYVIYPVRGAQSVSETAIDAFTILLGAAGVYLAALSGRQTTKPRIANFYLVLALMLIGSAIYIGVYIYSFKG